MTRCRFRRSKTGQTGFTLVELMVVTALTLFIVVALGTLFTNSSAARREIDSSGQQIENGRYAMALIRDDVRLAGYYGEFIPPFGGVTWRLPANPCDPTLANLGWNATGTNVPVAISGFEGSDPAIAALQCISDRMANTDVLVVRRVTTTSLAPPPAAANTPFLQVSLQSRACVTTEPAFVFDIPQSPSPFTLHKMNCATASLVRQYLVHVYYVSTCDDCTQNDGIPTLKRVELSANSMITASLTQGIVDFRVEYGQDTGNDGAADAYRKCGADNACAAADWANVMVVKVYLLTRNMEPTPGYVDTKVYTMGLSGQLPAVGATERTYKHHVYASPIRVIGQSDLREMP